MKSTTKKIIAGLSGAGVAALIPAAALADAPVENTTFTAANGNEIVVALEAADADLAAVPNVQGVFAYSQNEVTPGDDVFSIFGATVESMCAKPMLPASDGTQMASYYVNVGGNIKKAYTVDIAEMGKTDGVQDIMVCSCGSSPALAQAAVVGVPIEKVIGLAELEDGVNTFTAYGADGYGIPMPLKYVLDNKAMLVYEVGGRSLGGATQLWMPKTVAAYFTRDVARIELTASEVEPVVNPGNGDRRGKIEIVNTSDSAVFHTGDEITFAGHADDQGAPITAIEVSLDGGQTWTVGLVPDANADQWVSWSFTTQIAEPGQYEFCARALTGDGVISPIQAVARFTVE